VDENWKDLIENPRLRSRLKLNAIAAANDEAESGSGKAARQPETRTWVVVRLIDADGKPVPGQKYQIQLPDSSIEEGTLDSEGSVRFNDILPGQCKVRFPDIHGKEWTPA
jgi:hypothetical protein